MAPSADGGLEATIPESFGPTISPSNQAKPSTDYHKLASTFSTFEESVAVLRDNAQNMLGIPLADGHPREDPSRLPDASSADVIAIDRPYNRLKIELESSLRIDWTPIQNFTLNHIVLYLSVDTETNESPIFHLKLVASATIRNLKFMVSAEVPDLSTGRDIFIAFNLVLVGTANADDILCSGQSVAGGQDWWKPSDVVDAAQMDLSKHELAASLAILLVKPSQASSSFQFVSLKATLGIDLRYRPFKDEDVELQNGSFRLTVFRNYQDVDPVKPNDQVSLQLRGLAMLAGATFNVKVEFEKLENDVGIELLLLASTKPLNARLPLHERQHLSALETMRLLTAESSGTKGMEPALGNYAKILPQNLQYIKDALARPGGMDFSLRISYLGLRLQEFSLAARLYRSDAFTAAFLRSLVIEDLLVSFDTLDECFLLQGILQMPGMRFRAYLSFERSENVLIKAELEDGTMCNLPDLARLDIFNDTEQPASQPAATDLVSYSEDHAFVEEAPIDLIMATKVQTQGYSAHVHFEIHATKATLTGHANGPAKYQSTTSTAGATLHSDDKGIEPLSKEWQIEKVRFYSHFGLSWEITPSIKLTDLGICFDVSSPTVNENKHLRGMLYAQWQLKRHNLLAYVIGKQTPDQSTIFVGFNLHSSSSGKASLADVLADDTFGDGFEIPEIEAVSGAKDDLGNQQLSTGMALNGRFYAKFKRSTDRGPGATWEKTTVGKKPDFRMTELYLLADISSTFQLFDNMALAEAIIELKVSNPLEKASREFDFEILGTLSVRKAQVRLRGLIPKVPDTESTTNKVAAGPLESSDANVLQLERELKESDTDITFALEAYVHEDAVTGERIQGHSLSGEEFLSLADTGNNPIDLQSIIPADGPAEPKNILSATNFIGKLVISQHRDSGKQTVVRGLKHICLSLVDAKPWPIIENKLVLENAKLHLTVADPRKKDAREVFLAAYGRVTVGSGVSQSKASAVVIYVKKTMTIGFIAQTSLAALLDTFGDSAAVELPPGLVDNSAITQSQLPSIAAGVHCVMQDRRLMSFGIHIRTIGALHLSHTFGLEDLFLNYSCTRQKDSVMRWVQLGGDLVLGDLGSKKAFRALATWADGTLTIDFSMPSPEAEKKYNGYHARQRPGNTAAALYQAWNMEQKPPEKSATREYHMATEMTVGDIVGAILPKEISDALVPEISRLPVVEGHLIVDQGSDKSWHVKVFRLQLADKNVLSVGSLSLRQLDVEYRSTVAPKVPEQSLPTVFPEEKLPGGNGPSATEAHEVIQSTSRGYSLVVSGVVERDETAMQLQVSCVQERRESGFLSDIVEMSVRAVREGSLTVTGLFHLLSLHLPTFEEPDGYKGTKPLDLQVKKATAALQRAQPGSSLAITSLQLETASVGSLELLESPRMTVQDLVAVVEWSGEKGAKGAICGRLAVAGITLWVVCSKTVEGWIFAGFGSVGDGDKALAFEDVGKSLELPAAYYLSSDSVLPSQIHLVNFNVRVVVGRSIKISAYGNDIWDAECGGVKFKVDSLGAVINVTNDTNINGSRASPRVYEAFIDGKLSFQSFNSTARAMLAIRPGHSKTLMATLGAANTSNCFQDLVSGNQDPAVSELATTAPNSIMNARFSSSGLMAYIDLTESKFLLAGHLETLHCHAVFFSKKLANVERGRGYHFTLSVSNLELVWPALKESILQHVHIKNCIVNIVSLRETVDGLKGAMDFLNSSMINSKDIQELAGSFTHLLAKADPKTPLQDGAWFFAEVEFALSTSMTEALEQLSESGLQPSITLYAMVPNDGICTTFSVVLQNFKLFGGAMTLVDIRGSYTIATTNKQVEASNMGSKLTLQAQLNVDTLATTRLQFKSSLIMQRGLTIITTEALGNDVSIKNPFSGAMFNVELVCVNATGRINTENSGKTIRSFAIAGGVKLGGDATKSPEKGESGLVGTVLFQYSKPMVTVLRYNQTISITEVFQKIIQPGDDKAGAWPPEIDQLMLKNAYLYYNRANAVITDSVDSVTYLPGFNIHTNISIGLEQDFTVSASIARKGMVLGGHYDGKIDLDFMQLENITLALDTTSNPKKYYIKAAVTFFGCSGINLELAYHPRTATSPSKFVGDIKYDGDAAELKTANLKIAYQEKHFTIENWEFAKYADDLKEIANLIKEIEKASDDKRPCGKIVGLIFDKAIKTKFDYHLSLPKGADKAPSKTKKPLTVKVSWDYTITVVGIHIHTAKLPSHNIDISGPFNLKELDTLLWNFVKDNFANIAEALVSDAEALGNLIGAMAVEKCAQQAISSILCRGSKNKRIVEHGKKLMKENLNQTNNTTEGVGESAGGGGGGAAAAVAAAAAGLTSAIAAFGGAFGAGAFGVLGAGTAALMASLLKAAPDDKDVKNLKSEATEAATKKMQKLEKEVAAAVTLSGEPTANFKDDGSIVSIDWSSVAPQFTQDKMLPKSYHLEWEVVLSPTNNVQDASAMRAKTDDTKFEAPGDMFKYKHFVFIFVRGRLDTAGKEIVSDWRTVRKPNERPFEPKRIELSPAPESTEQAPAYLLDLYPQATGRHVISICVRSEGSESHIWTKEVQVESLEGPIRHIVPISEFSDSVWKYDEIKGYAAHMVGMGQATKWSDYAKSPQSFPIIPGPSNLTGSATTKQLTLEWDQSGTDKADSEFKVIAKDGKLMAFSIISDLTVPAGKRKATLSLSSLDTTSVGQELQVQIATRPLPSGAVTRRVTKTFKLEAPPPEPAPPLTAAPPLVENGDFSAGFWSWTVEKGNHQVGIASGSDFDGLKRKVYVNLRKGDASVVRLRQRLNTVPGRRYILYYLHRFHVDKEDQKMYIRTYVSGKRITNTLVYTPAGIREDSASFEAGTSDELVVEFCALDRLGGSIHFGSLKCWAA